MYYVFDSSLIKNSNNIHYQIFITWGNYNHIIFINIRYFYCVISTYYCMFLILRTYFTNAKQIKQTFYCNKAYSRLELKLFDYFHLNIFTIITYYEKFFSKSRFEEIANNINLILSIAGILPVSITSSTGMILS